MTDEDRAAEQEPAEPLLSPAELAEVEALPLADRAERYLAILDRLRGRLEEQDRAG